MRESEPQIGQASSMSSATPAAFWSAMSITTTSASDLSATPRATVAPTFPAPPTTVTFRFISSKLLASTGADSTPRTQWTQRKNPLGLTFVSFVSFVLESTLESSHVPDNRIGELRRLQLRRAGHLTRQVIGHLLLTDGLLEPALDKRAGFGPSEIVEHHDAGQNDRARVDDVLAGILRRRTVRRLEERDVVPDVSARRHAKTADLRRARV